MSATTTTGEWQKSRCVWSDRAFFGAMAILFTASAAVTVAWCGSMSAMGGMPMPGGWTMSMAWMRMPGQTWAGAAAAFLGMWAVMMVAMMLPAVTPMLWRYRQAIGETTRAGGLTALAGLGYYAMWTLFGAGAFPLGVALAGVEMQSAAVSRAVPVVSGAIVLIAGALQFTAWKARCLACCRAMPGRALPVDAMTALRHGLRCGLHCGFCCAGPTAILFVLGVMDRRAMALVTAAISIERLAPAGEAAARAIGAVSIGAGLLLIAKAAGPG
jgi:predicted metal-binding membrane protein